MNNQLTPQQAIQNLKAGLDIATKKGAFENLEQAATLLQSLVVLNGIINEQQGEKKPDDNN